MLLAILSLRSCLMRCITKCQGGSIHLVSNFLNKGFQMETLVTVIHVLVALILIGLVLIQDSKGGALGIGGGGGSNTVLGAGGAQTLAAKATRWVAAFFAITSIGLSVMTAQKTKSVVETVGTIAVPAATVPAATATPAETAPATSEAPATEAAPAKK